MCVFIRKEINYHISVAQPYTTISNIQKKKKKTDITILFNFKIKCAFITPAGLFFFIGTPGHVVQKEKLIKW